MWTRHTNCTERTCDDRFTAIPTENCAEIEGCTCTENSYRNDEGECVSNDECSVCSYAGIEYQVNLCNIR